MNTDTFNIMHKMFHNVDLRRVWFEILKTRTGRPERLSKDISLPVCAVRIEIEELRNLGLVKKEGSTYYISAKGVLFSQDTKGMILQ